MPLPCLLTVFLDQSKKTLICNLVLFLLLCSWTHFVCITMVSFALPTQIDRYVCTYVCNLILYLCMSAEVHAWFLEIAFSHKIGVCVSAPKGINN